MFPAATLAELRSKPDNKTFKGDAFNCLVKAFICVTEVKMKISTKGRYALRLMLDIAANQSDSVVTVKDVAKRQNISEKYLERIINSLVKADLLTSTRGFSGGYRLNKPASEYNVRSILEVTESSVAPVACMEKEKDSCNSCDNCVTSKFWKGLDKVVNDYLEGTTLQDLLDRSCGCNK